MTAFASKGNHPFAIDARDLRKRYGGVLAVDGLRWRPAASRTGARLARPSAMDGLRWRPAASRTGACLARSSAMDGLHWRPTASRIGACLARPAAMDVLRWRPAAAWMLGIQAAGWAFTYAVVWLVQYLVCRHRVAEANARIEARREERTSRREGRSAHDCL